MIIMFVLFVKGISQEDEIYTDEKKDLILQQVENELKDFLLFLEQREYLTDEDRNFEIEFQCDTFVIERLLKKRLESDYSTQGMTQAIYEAESAYDNLLNKYYKMLRDRLEEEDRELWRGTQRNWIRFRDSERKLNMEISKALYTGGGTIQQLFVADKFLEITRSRVFEIHGYLSRMMQF